MFVQVKKNQNESQSTMSGDEWIQAHPLHQLTEAVYVQTVMEHQYAYYLTKWIMNDVSII